MKLAVLGGSFNPVHIGHLFVAQTVISSLQCDRVVMVPAYRSPFKLSAKGMEETAKDRMEMLAASIAADPRLTFDDCEIRREGISYTVDTLKDIIFRYMPTGKPVLVIGDDLAAEFPKWRENEKILELADIVIARRQDCGQTVFPFPNIRLDNDFINVSSAMVRERVGSGENWRALVPEGARAVIEEKRLYGLDGGAVSGAAEGGAFRREIFCIEALARETLGIYRFIHSRNTALLAYDLCRRFALEPAAGYLAGIAHDLCKGFKDKEVIELAQSDGRGISKLERDKPGRLLHGRAAAVLLKERFCIYNKDILDAVAFHTTGGSSMGALAKVVYIADKAEVSRESDAAALRRMCREEADLDRLFFAALSSVASKLHSKKHELSDESLRLLEVLKAKYS
ncbi:MAG: nicotinate (nicotinamide) nucleotide adenylyltransferase [Spirochaetes bacterium]|nr:nicotinate (nicotinamide) nucleotide adenylyltransferase [Spirochaetota bacterium]